MALPHDRADQLLWHMRTCPTCIGAKIAKAPWSRCRYCKALIRLTLKERHG